MAFNLTLQACEEDVVVVDPDEMAKEKPDKKGVILKEEPDENSLEER